MSCPSSVLYLRQITKPSSRYKAGLREDIKKELLTVRLVSVEEAY
jgi:hypothetical protein